MAQPAVPAVLLGMGVLQVGAIVVSPNHEPDPRTEFGIGITGLLVMAGSRLAPTGAKWFMALIVIAYLLHAGTKSAASTTPKPATTSGHTTLTKGS